MFAFWYSNTVEIKSLLAPFPALFESALLSLLPSDSIPYTLYRSKFLIGSSLGDYDPSTKRETLGILVLKG